MDRLRKVFTLVLAGFTLSFFVAINAKAQTNAQTYGNSTYGKVNGQDYQTQKFGNSTYGNVGSKPIKLQKFGNSTYGNVGDDAVNHQQYGNSGYGKVGDKSYSTQKYGNATAIRSDDGSSVTCRTYGNSTYCN